MADSRVRELPGIHQSDQVVTDVLVISGRLTCEVRVLPGRDSSTGRNAARERATARAAAGAVEALKTA